MSELRRNWQWSGLLVVVSACGAATSPLDAGSAFDAGSAADAGSAVDAGAPADAGADAGLVIATGWARTADTPYPTGLWGTMLAFDPVDRRFILHGGNRAPNGSVQNETWSFSIATATWTKLTTTGAAMPYRYCHCTTYLPAQRQVLVAGGRNTNSTVDSAYTLDLATLEWTQVMGTVPTGGIGCNAHWLPSIARAIVFGGDGAGGVNDRTWSYDPVARTFTQLSPMTRPPARRDAMTMFDPVTNRVLMFGGAVRLMQSYLDDVATFDGTSWTLVPPSGPRPSPRRYGASGYDPVHRRWVLFGGTNDADDFGDVWTVDPATLSFEQQQLTGTPSRRGFTASGVDETTGVLYVFGGLTTSTFAGLADSYTLKLP